jgi:ribosomal protein S18 acetylase RimI-like enzyme
MDISFRTETEADIPLLFLLYAGSRATELAPVPWSVEQKQQFLEQQFFAQRSHYYQHYESAEFSLILLEGQPVGRWYVHRGIELRLMDVIVAPEFQQRGIAKACFAGLIAESRAKNLPIMLHVEINNHARDWYKRLGFLELPQEASGVYVKMCREPS